MARERTRSDIYFVLGSGLVCAFLFFSVIMPRVETNRAVRKRLETVAEDTKAVVGNVSRLERKARALETRDPFFVKASLRRYLELEDRPWSDTGEKTEEEGDAGHSEPGGS